MVTLKKIMYDVNNDDEMSEEKRKRIWNSILKAIFEWKKDRTQATGDITDKGDKDNGSK